MLHGLFEEYDNNLHVDACNTCVNYFFNNIYIYKRFYDAKTIAIKIKNKCKNGIKNHIHLTKNNKKKGGHA